MEGGILAFDYTQSVSQKGMILAAGAEWGKAIHKAYKGFGFA